MFLKIVFMGTPEFAAVSLKEIINQGYDIKAVFTQPDKPKGRGYKLEASAVKKLAQELNLNVYQPATLRDSETVSLIESLAPDIIVVIAYGRILTKQILDIPKYGCVNIHGSLLPQYRGAGPVQWSIINGEKYAGVTSMFMNEGLDTGDMIIKDKILIDPDETSGQLMERLAPVGTKVLIETLKMIETGNVVRIPQDDNEATLAPMLDKSLSNIDFNKSAREIHNMIRGINPWPVAKINYSGKVMKVYKSKVIDDDLVKGIPGQIIDDKKFVVACKKGLLELLEIQLEGKKRMKSEDFLRGHKIKRGDIVSSIKN